MSMPRLLVELGRYFVLKKAELPQSRAEAGEKQDRYENPWRSEVVEESNNPLK
jgi:hypothetical protein